MKRTLAIVGVATIAATAFAQTPRMTPRGSEVRLYPAPAVTPIPAGQALGPYSAGLAAAAPVGTPYLRSPAFAGPPIIYMPQTVTRVLVPAVTPYPGNVMQATNYIYASAPFMRTDIYTSLPYGTYYWPQGFAGAQPVAPTLPVYVEAPATAIMSAEASYAAQRYAPGAAGAEVISPVTCMVTPTPEAPKTLPPSEMVLLPEKKEETPKAAPTPVATPSAPAAQEKSPFSPDVKVPPLAPPPAATPAPTTAAPAQPTPAPQPEATPAAPPSLPSLAPLAPPVKIPNQ
jgi:hypothetical protein